MMRCECTTKTARAVLLHCNDYLHLNESCITRQRSVFQCVDVIVAIKALNVNVGKQIKHAPWESVL